MDGPDDEGARRAGLTVVVPTYRREQQCLEAIAAVDDLTRRTDLDVELIVVEQGERPSYRVPEGFRGRWLFSEVNGAAYARNLGLEAATKPAIAFLDDDGTVLDGIVDLLAEFTATGAAVACGRLLDPDGQVARGGDHPAEISARNAFRFFIEGTAIWGTEQVRAAGGFDERLGLPQLYGAEEGAELLGRVLRGGGVGRFVPADVLEHPRLDDVPHAKARQYGRGAAGTAWVTPSAWMLRYAAVCAVRRLGGAVVALVRGDRHAAAHRCQWLVGFTLGVLTGWRLRRRPSRQAYRPVVSRVPA